MFDSSDATVTIRITYGKLRAVFITGFGLYALLFLFRTTKPGWVDFWGSVLNSARSVCWNSFV